MTTFTLQQLREGLTLEQAIDELKELLEDQDLDTTDWTEGSPAQTVLQLQAFQYSSLSQRLAAFVDSSLNQFSSGSGLTVLSDSQFDNVRTLSSVTQGRMIVSASAVLLPKTFQIGELKVTDGSFIFENVNQIVLNASTNLVTASFQGESPGSDFNIATDSTINPVQTEVGLSVTNPAIIATNTWISLAGNDEEEDGALSQRNDLKWSSLEASEFTHERVEALALTASADVFFVSVDDQNPRGPFTADVYLANLATTASTGDVELVQTKLDAAFFGNSTTGLVSASKAVEIQFSSSIEIYYNPTANLAEITDAAEVKGIEFISEIPIGGKSYLPFDNLSNVASLNDLIFKLEGIEGVNKTIIIPNTDLTFLNNEKLTVPSDWSTIFTFFKLNQDV